MTHIAGLQVWPAALLAGERPVLDLAGGFDPAAFVAATSQLGTGRRYTSLVPTQLRRLLSAGPAAVEALRATTRCCSAGRRPRRPAGRGARRGVQVRDHVRHERDLRRLRLRRRAAAGVEVRLDDLERTVGRIRVGGDVVFSGYRLRPDLTAAALEFAEAAAGMSRRISGH